MNIIMGIDIYATWRGQRDDQTMAQGSAWLSILGGKVGYLREAYHGEPYATRFLCPEAFQENGARIPAAILNERLPETLRLVEERERTLYHSGAKEIEAAKQDFRDFVTLCERKEKETGEPVLVTAWY